MPKNDNPQLKVFPKVLAKKDRKQRLQLLDGFAYGIQCYVESRRQGTGKGCSDRTPVIKAISDGMKEAGELRSVRELHEWLTRKLGANRAGSLKRVEKNRPIFGVQVSAHQGGPEKFRSRCAEAGEVLHCRWTYSGSDETTRTFDTFRDGRTAH